MQHLMNQGPKGSIESDKVLLEGWWKKKGGKGHINQKTGKHRYFILTPRYLDWYEKPGYKRCGTVSLEQIYVRKQPDNITLVVGQFGGKEFKITSEGQDPETRVEEWYKDIQKAMENVKKVDKKTTLSEGFDAKKKTSRESSPQRKEHTTESTPHVPTTSTESSPAVPQTQSAPQLQTPIDDQPQTQIMPPQSTQIMPPQSTQIMPPQQSQIMPPQQPQTQQPTTQIMPPQSQMMPQQTPPMQQQMMPQMQQQSQMMPQMQQQSQMMPQMQQQVQMMPQMQQQTPMMQTSFQQPMMQTVVQPQMVSGVSYTQQIPTMNTGVVVQQSPIATTTSFSPFGVQQTFATPVTTVSSFATPAVSQTICMACRRPFPMIPGQLMMRCPYCQFVVGGTTVVQQVPMGAPVFY
jgi:LSD1 subclass zinc finger protein